MTYYRDVQPLLARSCTGCHEPGGIAPFPLHTYEEAAASAAAIANSTADRRMPPFHADNTGACNTFETQHWLSESEIALLGTWASEGAPEGDAVVPVVSSPDSFDDATHEGAMTVPYTPSLAADDDFRCFVVEPAIQSDGFLTAYEVIPGDRRVVHHLGLFALTSEDLIAQAEQLDEEEPGPGYECVGGPRVGGTVLGAWGPGMPVTRFPEGTGIRIPSGSKLVLQMHYSLLSGAHPDQTKVRIKIAPSVLRESWIGGLGVNPLDLPPHDDEISVTKDFPLWLFPSKATVYGVAPHMHTLGIRFHVEIVRNGVSSCLVKIPKWDFHWHQMYWYRIPQVVQWGDSVRITCTWDTTSRVETVHWGEGTRDEMCNLFVYATSD